MSLPIPGRIPSEQSCRHRSRHDELLRRRHGRREPAGQASAILCFTRAARRDESFWPVALRTLDWTLDQMYDPRGFFYYQKTRRRTKRFSLQRWCNGWMTWALASVLRMEQELAEGSAR